jgi:hypothetical protein
MEKKEILIRAIRNTEGLPAVLREHADKIGVCEDELFDESDFKNADEHIQSLSPSDPSKAELAKKWAAFRPFCNITLFQGSLWTDETAFNFWVAPETTTVIHWRQWSQERFKLAREMIDVSKKLKALQQKSER